MAEDLKFEEIQKKKYNMLLASGLENNQKPSRFKENKGEVEEDQLCNWIIVSIKASKPLKFLLWSSQYV